MNALVIGGSRFIGKRLARELIAAGHRVTLFNRGRTPDGLGGGVERLQGDRRSPADVIAALGGRSFDAAYDFLSYDAGDARVAVEALSGRVGHFVHISTCSVYWCTGDFPCPVPEEDFDRIRDVVCRPGSIEYDYGYGKRKAEEVLFAAHRERGFPATCIRMPIVGGEEDPSLRYASYCLRVADGSPLILPDGGLAPFRHVYVGDAARTLAALPSFPRSIGQAYNLACAEILSVRDVVGAIAALLGRQVETVDVPAQVLGLYGLGTEFSPFSQRASQVPAIFKARRDLGYEPTPYGEWLERVVRSTMSASGRATETPPAYRLRQEELRAIERYRREVVSSGVEDGTSAAPRG